MQPDTIFPEKTIRGYRIVQRLGAGGSGEIFLAHQEFIDRQVAIKVIHNLYANDPKFIQRFEFEARLIAKLEHPYIVPLFDYWRDPSGAYLVMRWLQAGSLFDALQQNRIWELSDVVRLMQQIGAALDIAHRRGIVHRDIKPGNILLDDDKNAYLSDFGIALDLSAPGDTGDEHQSIGSPAYMPPEQIQGMMATPRADIYSLGIMLYELLVGELPYKVNSVTELIRLHLTGTIPSASANQPSLPPEIDEVLWQATELAPNDRHLNVRSLVHDLEKVLAGHSGISSSTTINSLTMGQSNMPQAIVDTRILTDEATAGENVVAEYNPYKGLRAFDEDDAADFFGRDAIVDDLVHRLIEGQHFMALVGAGGSGKSSLVRAGIIPALRNRQHHTDKNWFIVTMQPGADPFESLAEALLSIATEPVPDLTTMLQQNPEHLHPTLSNILPDDMALFLLIDQFEELFTLTTSGRVHTQFMEMLAQSLQQPDTPLYLMLTLRADYYDRPLMSRNFGTLLQQNTQVLYPLSMAELTIAITAPAQQAGITLEKELVTRVIADVEGQSGTLPLLQYTLTELYEQRTDNQLSVQAYERLGGVAGALAKRATDLYMTFDAEKQQIIQRLFLRLIVIDNIQGKIIRKRTLWKALFAGIEQPDVAKTIVQQFSEYRLLTLDRDPTTRSPTVEIAHEALIEGWTLFKEWVESNRADLRLQQRLSDAVREWDDTGRDSSYLAAGARQLEFEHLLDSSLIVLSPLETDFIQAGIARKRGASRRRQAFIMILCLFSVVSLGLAGFALNREYRAQLAEDEALIERDRASDQAQLARSRELAAIALSNTGNNDLSLLLSLAALETSDTFEARNALLTGLQANPFLESYLHGVTGDIRGIAMSDDGKFVMGIGDTITIWQMEPAITALYSLAAPDGRLNSIAISPDNMTFATAGDAGSVAIYALESGMLIKQLDTYNTIIRSLAYSPDASYLAVGADDGTIRLHHLEDNTDSVINGHDDIVYALTFHGEGQEFASASADSTIKRWSTMTGDPVGETLRGHDGWIMSLAYQPGGQQLASGGVDGILNLWDLTTDSIQLQISTGHQGWIRTIDYHSAGQFLATGSADSTIRLFNASTGQLLTAPLSAHSDAVWGLAFQPNSTKLVSGGLSAQARLWNIRLPQRPGRSVQQLNTPVLNHNYSPDNRYQSIATEQSIMIYEQASGNLIEEFMLPGSSIMTTAFDPSGTLFAAGGTDSRVVLWFLDADTSTPILDIFHAGSPVQGLFFNDDSTALIVIDEAGSLWNIRISDGLESQILTDLSTSGILSSAMNNTGTLLALGQRDGSISLIDMTTPEVQQIVAAAHENAVMGLAFSPDDTVLYSVGRDRYVIAWDVSTGQQSAKVLSPHIDWITGLAISKNNQFFATGSRDGSVILWDVATLRPLAQPLSYHSARINSLHFSPDLLELASGGADNTVVYWHIGLQQWQMIACTISHRDFMPEEISRFYLANSLKEVCNL